MILCYLIIVFKISTIIAAVSAGGSSQSHHQSSHRDRLTSSESSMVRQVRRFLHPSGLVEVITWPFKSAPSSMEHVKSLLKGCEIELLLELTDKLQKSTVLLDIEQERSVFKGALDRCPVSSSVLGQMLDKLLFLDLDRDLLVKAVQIAVRESSVETLEKIINYNHQLLDGSVIEKRWQTALMHAANHPDQSHNPSAEYLLSDTTFNPSFNGNALAKAIVKQKENSLALYLLINNPLFTPNHELALDMLYGAIQLDSQEMLGHLYKDPRWLSEFQGSEDDALNGNQQEDLVRIAIDGNHAESLAFLINQVNVPISDAAKALALSKNNTQVLKAMGIEPVIEETEPGFQEITDQDQNQDEEEKKSDEDESAAESPSASDSSSAAVNPSVTPFHLKVIPFIVTFLLLL